MSDYSASGPNRRLHGERAGAAAIAVRLLFGPWAAVSAVPLDADAQAGATELLLPGAEVHATELPANPGGTWWVLHRPTGSPILEPLEVVVTPVQGCGDEEPDQRNGRVVTVPEAREPILLIRGAPGLSAGPVRTAFVDEGGSGEATEVEVAWDDDPVRVRHLASLPPGGEPGEYRIELVLGDRGFPLHADTWHGDGYWLVRWIGDLNRDGLPDVLLDASYKYSVQTTRLFLSRETDGNVVFTEAARFEQTAC